MKNKIVGKAINRILLAVVTINLFVVFLPRWIATILEVLTLGGLLYEYLPAITRKLYETHEGTFTEKWWIRLLIVCFAIPGYFIAFQSQSIVYLLLFILVVEVLVLGLPLAYAWNKENKGVPPDQQSFWKAMARGQRKNLAEEWEKYKKSLNKLSSFCWYYAPGLCLSAMGICFFAIFLLFSWYSQLFTLLSIGYLLANVFLKFERRNKSIDKELLELPLAIKGWKGAFGFMCIFAGFAISGMCISYELANFQYPLYLSIVNLFLQLPPFLYQFVFWYAILKRFPYFLHCWQSGFQKDKTLSLPTGQIYAFVGSCVSPFYIFIAPSMLQRLFSIRSYYLVFSLWLMISLAFIALIVHTLIKWRGEKALEDVHADNVTIPLAVFAQFMLLFGAGYVLEKSILNEMSLTSLPIGIVLIILFFVDDWENRWKHRYGEGLISDIFGILLPVFVILTLVNFITFVWLQPVFFLELVLSIIVVSLIILDMGKYRVLCRDLLHKFCVSLTNTIFKALNIIKEYCNRLFLVLKRKEVINKAINGFLLAVVTVNVFVNFLPKSVATAFGLLILCKLLYEYLPDILCKLYGDFAKRQTVISYFMFCAIPGYIVGLLSPSIAFRAFYITVVMGGCILSCLLSDAYHSYEANKGVELQNRKFYKVIVINFGKAGGDEEYQLKWWERYKNLPDSITKKIYKDIILSLPGLYLWFLGLLFFGIFLLFSRYSQFFTVVFVGWLLTILLKYTLPKPKRWNEKKSNIKRELLNLVSFVENPKGFCSALILFAAFLITGDYVDFLLSTYIPGSPIDFLYLFLLLPPFSYQFAFWYSFLRRLPSFIHYWEGGSSMSSNYVLPTGGIYAFIASCICAGFFPYLINTQELIYLLLLPVSFAYIFLILHTIKKWRKRTLGDVCRDNLRIPLAFLVQIMSYPPFYKYKLT